MPAPFPHHYQTELVRTLSSRARLEAPPRPPISGGPPPEFDGDATAWSSEQMLLGSVGLCLLTTFEAFAARDRLELLDWRARVGGTVDKTPTGLQFTHILAELDMEVREVSDIETARTTLEHAKARCLVLHALRVPVEVVATIRPAARKAG